MKRSAAALLLCAFLGAPQPAAGREPDVMHLTLDQTLQLAMTTGADIRKARLDSVVTEARWRAARALLYPQLRLYGDAPDIRESIDEAFIYDPNTRSDYLLRYQSSDQRWQAGLSLSQDLPWGASLDLSTRLYRRWWRGTAFSNRDSFTEYSLLRRVTLDQPLLAGNPVGREYKISSLSYISGKIDLEMSRRDIIYNAKSAFFGLVRAQESLEIAASDLASGRSADSLAQRKLKAGLIPEVELLQIQVDLARREGAYRESEDALEAAMDRLRVLLDLQFNQPVAADWSPAPLSEADSGQWELAGERPELAQDKLNLTRSEMETRAQVLAERIRASLQVYYEMDARRDRLEEVTQEGDRNLGVSLSFEIPLWGFGRTSSLVQEKRAVLKRKHIERSSLKSSLAADNREALRAVQRALDRVSIAEAAVALSEKSFTISTERFDNGLISSRDLLDAQLDLTRARREALNARIDFELAVAYLAKIAPLETAASL